MSVPYTAEEIALREYICERVMLVWEASGLGKSVFAQTIGISAPLLANYAKFHSTPSHTVLTRICHRYGMSPDYFYPPAKKPVSTRVVQRAQALAEEREKGQA